MNQSVLFGTQQLLLIKPLRENTNTDLALREIQNKGYLTKTALGCRNGVQKHMLILTDGNSDNPEQSKIRFYYFNTIHYNITQWLL